MGEDDDEHEMKNIRRRKTSRFCWRLQQTF